MSDLWEVFIRPRRGLAHTHVGSLHAPDAEIAAAAIVASSPDEKDAFFDPAADKVYRHPTFYQVPEGAAHL
jgi:ring-1,2-phenylacetyl-CoA epoxidase subunit PaaB